MFLSTGIGGSVRNQLLEVRVDARGEVAFEAVALGEGAGPVRAVEAWSLAYWRDHYHPNGVPPGLERVQVILPD